MSGDNPVLIRALGSSDHDFQREMLYAAAFWRRSAVDLLKRILLRKYLAQYQEGWGRSDTGFVAEIDGSPVGAVWYRMFTTESHGDGFVDE